MAIPLTKYWTSPNGNRARTSYIVFHHAAFTYPIGGAVLSIYNYHRSRWPKYAAAGYHVICQQEDDGIRAYQMNPHDMQGAGVANRNHECYHVCAATNFTGMPSADWLEASAQALADAQRRYPLAKIVGHKEIATPGNGTTCPGALWATWKPQLLARVDQILAPPPPAAPFAAWGDIDKPTGIAQGFGVPQTWLKHQKTLGACLRGEWYELSGQVSRALFQGGEIRWFAPTNTIEVLPYPQKLPAPEEPS